MRFWSIFNVAVELLLFAAAMAHKRGLIKFALEIEAAAAALQRMPKDLSRDEYSTLDVSIEWPK